MNDIVL